MSERVDVKTAIRGEAGELDATGERETRFGF